MDNCEMEVEDSTLIIKVDLSAEGSLSSSKKSRVIASTRGNVEVGSGVKVGLNVYIPVSVSD